MYEVVIEKINLKNLQARKDVEEFLNEFDLNLDEDVDYTIVIRAAGKIKATCSKSKNVLKCFAISKEVRGEGITATLISALLDKLFEEGINHSFIFTKPANIDIFTSLNYKVVCAVEEVALLENGIFGIDEYLNVMMKKYKIEPYLEKAALVMNCNPFTLGHQYLIEEASKNSKEVLLFIVEEDQSLFPFEVRYALVKQGIAHLKNVTPIPGGQYIISSATFPSYFLRKEDEKLKAYTKLDAEIFCNYFCKKLNIKERFVGEEPYCRVTNIYNDALETVLYKYGIKLNRLTRKEVNREPISASMVRNRIKEDRLEEIKDIIPAVTWKFLSTNQGKEIMEKIKKSNSPH